MMTAIGLEPLRCHSYDVSNPMKKTHHYSCQCIKNIQVSSTVNNRINKGAVYICKKCKHTLIKNI